MRTDGFGFATFGARGVPVLPSKCAQCRSPPAVNSRPALNACDVRPLDRHSATRRAHIVASAMRATLRPWRYPRETGSVQRLRVGASQFVERMTTSEATWTARVA